MIDKILCVDDEPNILQAFRRQLRSAFELEVAHGPAQAIEILSTNQKFAVVMTDMRMPGMDGVQFLKEVERLSPDSVRIMLTGNADKGTPVTAINEGHVFRFLQKPVSIELLEKTLRDATEHYHITQAEKALLQNTVGGSIKLLTEIVATVDQAQFAITKTVKELAHTLLPYTDIKNTWELDLSIYLADIGRVTLPAAIRLKQQQGIALNESEQRIVERLPEVSASLIKHIPRFEKVAENILHRNAQFDGARASGALKRGNDIPYIARFLKIVRDLTELPHDPETLKTSILTLQKKEGFYDPKILDQLINGSPKSGVQGKAASASYAIGIHELCAGQVLLADVKDSSGKLLLTKGAVVSEVTINQLKNYKELVGVIEPLQVDARIPVESV